MRMRVPPQLAVGLGVLGVSVASILVRMSQAPPLTLAAYRLLFATLFLAPVWLARHEPWPKRETTIWAVISGVCLALHLTLWFAALAHTSVTSATVLVTMHPLFVLIGTYLLWGQKPHWQAVVGVIMGLVGSVFLAMGQPTGSALKGDLLALAAAAFMAVYLLIGQIARRNMSLLAYVVIVYGCGALVAFAAALVGGVRLAPFPQQEWGIFILLALVPTLCGHTLFNWALQQIPAAYVSVATLGEPVFASLWAAIWFAEHPAWLEVLGAVMVLLGMGVFLLGEQPRNAAHRDIGGNEVIGKLSRNKGKHT